MEYATNSLSVKGEEMRRWLIKWMCDESSAVMKRLVEAGLDGENVFDAHQAQRKALCSLRAVTDDPYSTDLEVMEAKSMFLSDLMEILRTYRRAG